MYTRPPRLITLSSLLLLVSLPAVHADIVTYTTSVPLASLNWKQDLTLPQFNPALGSLDSIALTAIGNAQWRYGIENNDTSSTFYSFQCAVDFTLTIPGNRDLKFGVSRSESGNLSGFDGSVDFSGSSGYSSGLSSTNVLKNELPLVTEFSHYIGNGNIGFTIGAQGFASLNSGGGNTTSFFSLKAGLDLTVAYIYTPAPDRVLTGKLLLGNLAETATAQSVTFTFRPNSGSAFSRVVPITPSGEFEITDLPRKPYTVHIKGAKWLAKNIAVDTTGGNVSGVEATLLAGDANDNNKIDIFDLGTLANDFNSQEGDSNWNGGRSDFNCDNSTDIFDLAILAENFNLDGDE